ncbi:MAG TPA: SDR family NAD(P)-dependent oxidoreductase [Acidimicrobiales bacterium]|nr:SDR family NAD(P)-dependent oxidoreductase [Acidimicrobiales bacterium]
MGAFEGARVLVTGASSGIGAGLAEAFAAEGATVGMVARRRDRLAEVLERCRAHAPASAMWVADLADNRAVDRLAGEVLEAFGGVDILVNNAGIPKRRHVTRLDPATVESVMAINYLSPVRLTLALLPHMLRRGSGRVVAVSSVAAPLSSPGEAAYDASKAALAVFCEAMAVDLWDSGIKVSVVYPGVVDTELFTLPDNDPFAGGVEAISVDEAVRTIMEGIGADAVSIYVPAYFAELASGKAQNVEGFLAGAAEFVRIQAEAAQAGPGAGE